MTRLPSEPIYLFGPRENAEKVARVAGLLKREWVVLDSRLALMGSQKPVVVMLDSARDLEDYDAIVGDIDARSGEVFTEFQLLKGRVPR